MNINRRGFLTGMLLAGAGVAGIGCGLRLTRDNEAGVDYTLIAEEAPIQLLDNHLTPALTYNGAYPAPVLHAKQGERLRVKLINKLCQPTTIHWHGLRLENAMDGVPYLTQAPVLPGESFIYDFLCPDAGTFWYHPHMHSIEQLGRGLTGCLIVQEATPVAFDADVLLQLRNWHLKDDGQFDAMTSHRHAARSGTLGNHATVNGKVKPVIDIPAGGVVRLRMANIDNTRVYQLSLKDYPAQVLAEDGNPLTPYPLTARSTGAGMRLDVGFIAPENIGEDVIVYDKKGRWYFELCRLRTVASSIKPGEKIIPALPAHHIPEPDLSNAEAIDLTFEWDGALTPADENGNAHPVFWTINRQAWMDHQQLPEPLAKLTLGKSYIFNLYNASPHEHPIHLHGQTFKILRSNKRKITPYFSDTILLDSNERAQIAFVADNPGKWMFHCHVIEHMDTGLMGYIEIA